MKKIKNLLIALGLAFSAGAGLAVGLNSGEAKEAKADNSYSVIGALSAYGDNWNVDRDLVFDGSVGYINLSLTANDEFKIRANHSWGGAEYGCGNVDSYPDECFDLSAGGTSNIYVKTTGFYRFAFNPSNDKEITITSISSTTRVYLDINDSFTSWANPDSEYAAQGFDLRCHYYGGASSSAWAGAIMTSTVHQFNRDIYYYDIPSDSLSVVFTRTPKDNVTNAWSRWNIDNGHASNKIVHGYNFFQPLCSGGSPIWSTASEFSTDDSGGGHTYGSYKAFNSTLHINGETSSELAVNWSAYNPANPYVSGKEFEGWYTNAAMTSSYTSATPTGNVELYAMFAESAKIVLYDSEQGKEVDGDSLSCSSTEWSVTSVIGAGQQFRIEKTYTNGTTRSFKAVQSESTAETTEGATYVTMTKGGTYSMYLKLASDASNPNEIYIRPADESSEAYSYADFFFAHVGCDITGANPPSGWGEVALRYKNYLSDDAKDFICAKSPDMFSEDKIEKMLAVYRIARLQHPNDDLENFLKDSAGVAKFSSVSSGAISVNNNSGVDVTTVIIITSIVSLMAVGSYFLLRRRKEQ